MKFLTRWTDFLNNCFDFGEKTLSNTGGLVVMIGIIVVITLVLVLTIISGPEKLPRT